MSGARTLEDAHWPFERLGDALESLGGAAGVRVQERELPPPPPSLEGAGEEPVGLWLERAGQVLGFEVEAVEAPYPQAERFLRACGPALLRTQGPHGVRYYALLRTRGNHAELLTPLRSSVRVPLGELVQQVRWSEEAPHLPEVEALLEAASIPGERRARGRAALLVERLRHGLVGGCWMVRPSTGMKFSRQLGLEGIPKDLLRLVAAHVALYALWVASWWLLGRAALTGHVDPGWLWAWALMLLTTVPLRMLELWFEGRLAFRTGALLKRRLLLGSLRLVPDAVRREGIGGLLGRVLEAEAVESLTLTGGLLGAVAALELLGAALVLASGAAGPLLVGLLAGWLCLVVGVGLSYGRARRRWTDERLVLTVELVERMVGHRTRLAQEPPALRHSGEDTALERYLDTSARMDRPGGWLVGLAPRGWLLVGVAGLGPVLLDGGFAPERVALSLGGILLAHGALSTLVPALANLLDAGIAWRRVGPLFHGAQDARPPAPLLHDEASPAGPGELLLDARDLCFSYPDRPRPAVDQVKLELCEGDRLLLEGPSGGGKSTLASLLTGARPPQSGLLLYRGLDLPTLGEEAWRERVVSVPQFHENHVLCGSFAFNLLMGAGWPAYPDDLEEARVICEELGLGPLLQRMPSKFDQPLGDMGWQLSHGERSRLFIARALLQRPEVLVLDESFAALDPENLERAMGCVLARARTLVVIAHP